MPISDQDQQKLKEAFQPRYLFVDDDLMILDIFEKFFSDKAEVVVATDGQDALDKITVQSFDAIISDVDMPIINGIDLLKCLHAKDPSITERFLFCSGYPSTRLEKFCFEYSIPCLCKPISLVSLQAQLAELCTKHNTRNKTLRTP